MSATAVIDVIRGGLAAGYRPEVIIALAALELDHSPECCPEVTA